MSEMLAAAPQVSQPLSGATSVLVGVSGSVDSMTSLASSFQQLNLSPSMVKKKVLVFSWYGPPLDSF
jgi:NH3-dependent NAD+ synthetase